MDESLTKTKKTHRTPVQHLIYLIEQKLEKLDFLKGQETDDYITYLNLMDETHKKQAKSKSEHNFNYRTKKKLTDMSKDDFDAYVKKLTDIYTETHQ